MRDVIFQVAMLAAMLTVGKFSTDAGYWVNLAALVIGAIGGAAMFTIAERRKRKSNAVR